MTSLPLMDELERRSIHLKAEGDTLRYVAPKGALTEVLRQALRDQKAELLQYARRLSLMTFLQELLIAQPLERDTIYQYAREAGYDRETTRQTLMRLRATGKVIAYLAPPRDGLCDLIYEVVNA